jgi:hypothetical protein
LETRKVNKTLVSLSNIVLNLQVSYQQKVFFSRTWKIKIYNIYTYYSLPLLWFVPAMIAQMFSLHQHCGNIGKITDITFELAAAISNSSIGLSNAQ